MKSIFRIVGIVIIILAGHAANAQDEFVYWPNANYDPAIPSVEDVLGYHPGERITWHRDAVRYFLLSLIEFQLIATLKVGKAANSSMLS